MKIAVLLVAGVVCCSAQTYTFQTLDVPSSVMTEAWGINSSGQIVGFFQDRSGAHGFIRNSSTGAYTVLDTPNAGPTMIYGINDSGQMVGSTGVTSDGKTFVPITAPNAIYGGTHAWGINNVGQIAGYYVAAADYGFVSKADGSAFTSIAASGAVGTLAFGVNDAGQTVGSYSRTDGNPHGFIRSADGSMFATIDAPAAQQTWAYGINNTGLVVGYFMGCCGGGNHGFVRLADGSFLVVDVPGAQDTFVNGINNAGQIVGYYVDAAGAYHGYLGNPGPSLTQIRGTAGVLEASDFGGFGSIALGSWIEVYGTGLANSTRSWTSSDFQGTSAPTSLDGVSVKVNGVAGFVSYVSPTQVNAQVPLTVTGPSQVMVTVGNSNSNAYGISVNELQPGLLAPSALRIGASQYVVGVLSDNITFALPTGAISGLPSQPARPGETITLYGIGFGPVSTASNGTIPPGQITGEKNTINAVLQIFFSNTPAVWSYAGLSPGSLGLYQLNVVVPSIPNSDLVPLSFTLDGILGSQTLFIAVNSQ